MLDYIKNDLIRVSNDFSEKEKGKYCIEQMISLSVKLGSCEDKDIDNLFREIVQLTELKHYRAFKKVYSKLTSVVTQRYGYQGKDDIMTYQTGMGIVFGTSIGVALTTVTTGGIAIGIAIGLGMGALLGKKKIKDLEGEDKLY